MGALGEGSSWEGEFSRRGALRKGAFGRGFSGGSFRGGEFSRELLGRGVFGVFLERGALGKRMTYAHR
jgi:hypothetical protein